MTMYDTYINGVIDGTIIVPRYVRLAVERHINDLNRDFEYEFDRSRADEVIDFVSKLRLPGGALQFKKWSEEMKPFQAWYFAMVYGWVHKETRYRRFTEVYWCTPRKSAKSAKTAAEALWHLIKDGTGSPVIQCVATKRDQAKYVYDSAYIMASALMRESKAAKQLLNLKQYTINNNSNFGYIECLTADSLTNDGGNAQMGSIDEYHAHNDSSMFDVVASSQGERTQPLIKVTTTAGFNKNGPDYAKRNIVKKILEGDIINDRLFGAIYEPDEGDDLSSPATWAKISPLYPTSPRPEYMQDQYEKAVAEGGERWVNFQTKLLNMYVGSADEWIRSELYKSCGSLIDKELLKGKVCVAGLDLASEEDTTAITYVFPIQEGLDQVYYYTDYFCPSAKVGNTRVDGVLYSEFVPEWMTVTDGQHIDGNAITDSILHNAENYEIKLLAYDPYKSIDIITRLQEVGIETAKVYQSAAILGMGNDVWKKMILNKTVRHDGSPVTSWQMGNIEMYTDGNGNQKIVKGKGKKKNKVDGPVSISNAFVAYLEYMKKFGDKQLTEEDLGYLG